MITRPISFIQIAISTDHIYGLTSEGEVFYRDKIPYNFIHNTTYYGGGNGAVKKEEDLEKKTWKKLNMDYKYEIPKGGEIRIPQEAEEDAPVIVEIPAHKVYRDVETVKRVQSALKERGYYIKLPLPDTYKIDGILAELTIKAIKEYQKSHNFVDNGDIDLKLCISLGLDKTDDEYIVAAIPNDTNVMEDTDVYAG